LALLKEAKPEHHGQLVTTLSLMGAEVKEMQPILEQMVKADRLAENRRDAAYALTRQRMLSSMAVLRERLRVEENENVRQHLAEALLLLRQREQPRRGN
jgi:hypothetical protein